MSRISKLFAFYTTILLISSCQSPQQSSPPPSAPNVPSSSPPKPSSDSPSPEQTSANKPSAQPPSNKKTIKKKTGPSEESSSSSDEQQRKSAAETLKKAGEKVSKNAEQLPNSKNDDWDPLTPESELSGDGYPEGWNEKIQTVQEALEQAGIALKTAGATLESAETDSELAEAEKALARARVSVIIAGQDLEELSDIYDSASHGDSVLEAENSLNEANIAIVVATDSVFDSRIDLPKFEPPHEEQGTDQSESQMQENDQTMLLPKGISSGSSDLDKEFDESIAIFEGKITDARNKAIASMPPPTAAKSIPGVMVLGGETIEKDSTVSEQNIEEQMAKGFPTVMESGNMPRGGEELKRAINDSTAPVPEDIPSAQGDDIVAQQLREAAAAETNPSLRKKLWDEYKKYKIGL